MSRIDELKKQNPHFSLNFFDIFRKMDPTKSGKYVPVFYKVFNSVIKERASHYPINELEERITKLGLNVKDVSHAELIIILYLTEFMNYSIYDTAADFITYMERGLIDNKDVLTYNNLADIRNAVSLAIIKEHKKELENQVKKEFEDDKWLVIRPMSFDASAKYGAGTKWCTTYKTEREYFAKYFNNGVLVYFINKISGYKFALFSEVYELNNEITFWNAEDNRVDFLQLDVDSYLLPVIKSLANSKIKNSEMLSDDERERVFKDCNLITKAELPSLLEEIPEPTVDVVAYEEHRNENMSYANGVAVRYLDLDAPLTFDRLA